MVKKFEERLERLEEIAASMRGNELGLDEALALFEEGIKLSKSLEKDLEKAEAKIDILLNKPEGPEDKPELDLFEPED
jgi:exodeoxyribonuclease VII small subunit